MHLRCPPLLAGGGKARVARSVTWGQVQGTAPGSLLQAPLVWGRERVSFMMLSDAKTARDSFRAVHVPRCRARAWCSANGGALQGIRGPLLRGGSWVR